MQIALMGSLFQVSHLCSWMRTLLCRCRPLLHSRCSHTFYCQHVLAFFNESVPTSPCLSASVDFKHSESHTEIIAGSRVSLAEKKSATEGNMFKHRAHPFKAGTHWWQKRKTCRKNHKGQGFGSGHVHLWSYQSEFHCQRVSRGHIVNR